MPGIPCERCYEQSATLEGWLCDECGSTLDKWDYKSLSVLAWDYSAYDLADHLADVMPETMPDGRQLWDLPAQELAMLAVDRYPGGACGLQLALEGIETATP